MVRRWRFSGCKKVGHMKTSTKLVLFELFGGLFGWVWIGASIATIYFLYGALVNDAPWSNLLWSIAIGFISKIIATAMGGNQRRLDYVDQLTERGYSRADAAAAWFTASNGGQNLLLSLQQAEPSEQITPLETATNTSNGEGDSA